MSQSHLTTRAVADLLTGGEVWRIQRLFEDGVLPEPERFAGKRAIPREMLPDIIDALNARGWLRTAKAEVAHAD